MLDALGTGPVVVYGHSLGGWVGLTLAAREPERVRALVVGDTGIDPRGIDPDLAVSYLADVPMALRSLAQAVRVMDPAVMEEFRAGTLADDFRPEAVLPQVRCPVLLLQADPAEGGLMTDSDVALGRRLLPDVAHVKFMGVGHGLHVEAAGAVASALEPLFARLRRPTDDLQGWAWATSFQATCWSTCASTPSSAWRPRRRTARRTRRR